MIPFLLIQNVCLEHFWLVVLLVLSWCLVAVTTWTSWASVVAAWTTVTTSTLIAAATLTVILARTSVATWLALRLNISLRLFHERSARESHLAGLGINL
jgi:hypothetical protein